MKIEKKSRTVKYFAELRAGDVFEYGNSIYLKIPETYIQSINDGENKKVNAFDVVKNGLIWIAYDYTVRHIVNAKLVY